MHVCATAALAVTNSAKRARSLRESLRVMTAELARFMEFLTKGTVIFFIFIFLLRLDLLTVLTAIQFRAEPGTILTRRFEQRPHFG